MIVEYKDYEFVIDPEIDFIMLRNCYHDGGNCYQCMDREFGECPIDEVSIEFLLKNGVVYD